MEPILWVRTLERKFIFNPGQPINPADLARIKAEIAQKRAQLEQDLRSRLTELRTVSADILQSRAAIVGHATAIWKELKQAEADEQAAPKLADVSKRRWLFGGLALATLWLSTSLAPQKSVVPTAVRPAPAVAVNRTEMPSSTMSQPVPTMPAPKLPEPRLPSVSPNSAFPPLSQPNGVAGIAVLKPDGEVPNSLWGTPMPSTPADQKQASPGKDQQPSSAEMTQPVQQRSDAQFINDRLHELGYLDAGGLPSSVQVTQAIRDMKVVNGLEQNDKVDTATVRLLNTGSPTPAQQSFLGGWSTQANCSQGEEMEVNSALAKTEAGSCKFSRILHERNGWKVQARCLVGSESWIANIKFTVVGRQLEWTSEKGRQVYYRCR